MVFTSYVISLPRRKDRLSKFLSNCPIPVEVIEAVNGQTCSLPSGWTANHAAYGCLQSHLKVLDKVTGTTLVLEDDAFFTDDFTTKVEDFFQRVPEWDALMLGGQHIQTAPFVDDGIVKCKNAQRTHGYVVKPGQFLEKLRERWRGALGHCDHYFGAMHAHWRVYAPMPFLIGQAASVSDIAGGWFRDRSWSDDYTEELLLTDTREDQYYYGDDNALRNAAFIKADKVGELRKFLLAEFKQAKRNGRRLAITGVDEELVQQAWRPIKKQAPKRLLT